MNTTLLVFIIIVVVLGVLALVVGLVLFLTSGNKEKIKKICPEREEIYIPPPLVDLSSLDKRFDRLESLLLEQREPPRVTVENKIEPLPTYPLYYQDRPLPQTQYREEKPSPPYREIVQEERPLPQTQYREEKPSPPYREVVQEDRSSSQYREERPKQVIECDEEIPSLRGNIRECEILPPEQDYFTQFQQKRVEKKAFPKEKRGRRVSGWAL